MSETTTDSKAVEERDKTVEVTYDIDYETCLGSSDNAMIYAANLITVTTVTSVTKIVRTIPRIKTGTKNNL